MDSLDKSMSQLTSEVQKVSQHLTTHHHIQEKIAPQIKPTCPSRAHLLQVRISGIPEKVVNSDERNKQAMITTHDHSAISKVFEKLGGKPALKNLQRLGRRDTSRASPRTLLVTLHSKWDVRKVLSKIYKLKDAFADRQIFVSPVLSPKDQTTERKLLFTRRNLIASGENRQEIKIKDMKLYLKGKVQLQETGK